MAEHHHLLWPSKSAAKRIIECVGEGNLSVDVERLRADLHDWRIKFLIRASGKSSQQTLRRKRATEIEKHARSLLRLLNSSGDGQLNLRLWFDVETAPLKSGLAVLADVAASIATLEKMDWKDGGIKNFAVQSLKDVYEIHFNRQAGRYRPRDGRAPTGPFIRFVNAVIREIGINISQHTMDRALKGTRRVGKNAAQ